MTDLTQHALRAEKTAPAGPAELWYRRMLLLYPADYRRRFADEMMEILMQSETPGRPVRASAGETWSLFRHGLQMRLNLRGPRGAWTRAASAGAAVLAALVAVLGIQTLIGSGTGYLITDASDRSTAIDPTWAAAALSVLTVGLLLLRLSLPALISAWASLAAGVWACRAAFAGLTSWGPPTAAELENMTMTADGQATQLALLVPALVLAVLLLRPGIGARAADLVGRRPLLYALAAGTLMAVWADYGMSQIWAPIVAGAVLLGTLVREAVLLRAGLLVTFAFGYLMVAGLADGSGSRLPGSGLPLAITVGVLPLLALLAGGLLISLIDAGTQLRTTVGRRLEAFGRSITARPTDSQI